MSAEARRSSSLRELVADMLAHNDECGPGPVSRQEYLADADEIVRLCLREAMETLRPPNVPATFVGEGEWAASRIARLMGGPHA